MGEYKRGRSVKRNNVKCGKKRKEKEEKVKCSINFSAGGINAATSRYTVAPER
jgi:hypothetical protein